MEKIAEELKKILPLKETTEVGDVVIIAAQEPQMLNYAIVNNIERDDSRKNEWWHVTMNLLTVPIQKVTWTLRTPQFTGQEIFTMGGHGRFIQAVDIGKEKGKKEPQPVEDNKKFHTLRVVK